MSTETTAADIVPLDALRFCAKTDIGLRREENQDSFGVIEGKGYHFFMVADGMGGVRGGAVASSLAVSVIKGELESSERCDCDIITAAVQKANTAIFDQGTSDPALNGMGTTLVGIAFAAGSLFIVNVGDSRAYRIRRGTLEQLTEDHTLVRELLKSKQITEDQATNHPISHMLTRSLGPSATVTVDSWAHAEPPESGDVYLLCSDGLYNLVHPEEIVEKVETLPFEEVAEELISLANLRGGTDNITVVLVGVGAPSVAASSGGSEAGKDELKPVSPLESAESEELESTTPDDLPGESEPLINGILHPPYQGERPQVFHLGDGGDVPPSDRATTPDTVVTEKIAQPRPQRRRFGVVIALVVATITVLVGVQNRTTREQSTAVTTAAVPSALPQERTQPPQSSSEMSAARSEAVPVASSSSSVPVELSLAEHEEKRREEERARLKKRRDELERQVSLLAARIEAFDRPISGETGELLVKSSEQATKLERSLGALRLRIEEATRELSVWYVRKKKIGSSDPVNLASEIASSSPAVAAQKEEFERITWSYLKDAEALRLAPTDAALAERVKKLATERGVALEKLAGTLSQAIDEGIARVDSTIAELAVEREKGEGELTLLRSDIAYARAVMSNDQSAKTQLRDEVLRELATSKAELAGISNVLSGIMPVNAAKSESAKR